MVTSHMVSKELMKKLVGWRRDFHMNPEVGFNEIRTSLKVAETLESMGVKVRRHIGKTGVVGELGEGKPIIALRADMDALPLDEKNQVDYASKNRGVMHACGHDAHTAMLLGAAQILSKASFPGSVRFLFQPSEEVCDKEGLSGASRMVQDGAMHEVDMVIATHVAPGTPVGKIRIEAGPASGGVDSWFGTIIGKGGHGAYPYLTIDPFHILGHVINELNAIISRRIAPFSPAVVSIGSINGGHTENVIPESITITGTLRYTEASTQKILHKEIKRAFRIAKVLGGDFELNFEIGDPPIFNAPQAVDLIERSAGQIIGPKNILPMTKDLGAEDFGVFSSLAPGAMFSLGARIDGDERIGHNPYFDIDEACLPIGTSILVQSALNFLNGSIGG